MSYEQFREQWAAELEKLDCAHGCGIGREIAEKIKAFPLPEVTQEPFGFLRIFKLNGKICDKTFVEKIPTCTIFEADLLKPYCIEYQKIFDLPPDAETLRKENEQLLKLLAAARDSIDHHLLIDRAGRRDSDYDLIVQIDATLKGGAV
ncbi:hypothetical protein ACO0LB_18535 [Undibacterium sp. SXout7W]|uniref:hypothetical protein n=1 Tax=Undibacterium sp. SXout7W TaxID=3413049 RepID=UPI003BF09486